MIKKVVISPTNKTAISFFEELNKKKEEIRKKIEGRTVNIDRYKKYKAVAG